MQPMGVVAEGAVESRRPRNADAMGMPMTGRDDDSTSTSMILHQRINPFELSTKDIVGAQTDTVLEVSRLLKAVVHKHWLHAELHIFGSRTCRLAIGESDIDFVVTGAASNAVHVTDNIEFLFELLREHTWAVDAAKRVRPVARCSSLNLRQARSVRRPSRLMFLSRHLQSTVQQLLRGTRFSRH